MKATDSPAVTPRTDSLPYPDTDTDTEVGPDRRSMPSTPRWVKAFGIVAIVLVLLIGGLMLFGGGSHGPSRHTPSGEAGGRTPPSSATPSDGGLGRVTPPSSVTEHGVHQPWL